MEKDNHLYILWTTDNPVTAMNMIMTYGGNSLLRGWWDEVTFILWGASDQLVATDATIQARIRELMDMGAHFTACKHCAEVLGVSSQLKELGIELKYWGEPMTELLKSGKTILHI